MAAIYGGDQAGVTTAQPATNPVYSPPTPSAPLDPMAQSLLGEVADQNDAAMMAGLEALVDDADPEPVAVFEPVQDTEVSAVEAAPDAPDVPAANTASPGGRLELPADLVDMLDEQRDGPQ